MKQQEQKPKEGSSAPEKDAKQKAAEHPTRDDVHEQREPSQDRPGVVHPGTSGAPKH